MTKTPVEISLVLGYIDDPSISIDSGDNVNTIEGIEGEATCSEGPWRCIMVKGPMPLGVYTLAGFLNSN